MCIARAVGRDGANNTVDAKTVQILLNVNRSGWAGADPLAVDGIAGRANYRAFGQAVGIDLLSGDNAERVATDPTLAVEVACWYWRARGINALADADDAEAVTRRINGGLNGFTDRLRQLDRARFFLQA